MIITASSIVHVILLVFIVHSKNTNNIEGITMKKVSKDSTQKVENKNQKMTLKNAKKKALAVSAHCQGGGGW